MYALRFRVTSLTGTINLILAFRSPEMQGGTTGHSDKQMTATKCYIYNLAIVYIIVCYLLLSNVRATRYALDPSGGRSGAPQRSMCNLP